MTEKRPSDKPLATHSILTQPKTNNTSISYQQVGKKSKNKNPNKPNTRETFLQTPNSLDSEPNQPNKQTPNNLRPPFSEGGKSRVGEISPNQHRFIFADIFC